MRFITVVLLVVVVAMMAQAQMAENVGIHGFVSQGYMNSSENSFFGNTEDGTFDFNEFGINFSTELTDELRIGMQLFARKLGYLGDDRIMVDWAYGDYRFEDWFGVRAGKMKMPLGLYNEIRDIDFLRTSIFLPQGVYNESWRETFNAIKGIGIYGTTGLGPVGSLSYQAQAGVLNLGLETGMNKTIEDQLWAHMEDYKLSTSYVGNLTWETPLSGLKLAASMYYTELSISGITEDCDFWRNQTVGAVRDVADMIGIPSEGQPQTYEEALIFSEGIGVDLNLVNIEIIQQLNDTKAYWLSGEYTYKNLVVAGEYFLLSTMATTSNPDLGELRSFENELGGFYGSVGYRFTDWFEAGSYYTEYYTDLSDKSGKGYESSYGLPASNSYLKDLALSLRFDVNPHWTIKAEGHKMDGTAVMFRQDQEDPQNVEKDWMLFAAKLTYNF